MELCLNIPNPGIFLLFSDSRTMPCGEMYLTKQVTRDLINTLKLHLPFSDSGASLAEVPLFDNLNEPSENPPGKK